MIQFLHNDIIEIHWQNTVISEIYAGSFLVWLSELKSCFANGFWIDNYPWTDEYPWIDNK